MPDNLLADLDHLLASRKTAAKVLGEHQRNTGYQRDHKRRIEAADAIAAGQFPLELPDGTRLVEPPKIANYVDLRLQDAAAVASEILPSVRCPDPTGRNRAAAEKREKIYSHFFHCNSGPLMLPRYYIDWMMAGVTYKCIYPDYESGFPRIEREDPRDAWPDAAYSPDRPLTSIVFESWVGLDVLAAQYPEQAAQLLGMMRMKDSRVPDNELVRVLKYYDKSESIRIAAARGAQGANGVVLSRHTSRLGRIPVVISGRATHDGEFRGIFDQALSTLVAQNRYENLLLDSAIDWLYSDKVEYGIDNPEDVGTGAILHANKPDGRVSRSVPASANPQIFSLLIGTADSARKAVQFPEGRTGDQSQSIISAAGVNSLQGSYNSSIAWMQRTEADAWSKALSIAAEIDEKYLDWNKTIVGSANQKRYALSYTPSKDLNGNHDVSLEYSGAAGGDQFSYEIRLTQQVSNGLVSRETAMEKLSTIEDVVEERKRLWRQDIEQAARAFIAAAASGQGGAPPDFAPAAALLEALDDPKRDIGEVLKEMPQIYQGQVPGGGGGTGLEAFTQASAISRGGAGNSALNVPGVGSAPSVGTRQIASSSGGKQLPPLSSVLVQS